MKKEVNTDASIRTVTSNDFITACGLDEVTLKARKLLYIAISQCKKNDKNFLEYKLNIKDFAHLMGIEVNNVYSVADALTDELIRGFIRVENNGHWRKYSLFSQCDYSNGFLYFKLNSDMTDFLLDLKSNFTQPLLQDFLRMRSPYSMEIWHLMQREMHSKKPGLTEKIEFDLSLDELRKVTGCTNKLKQIGQFKERVLDKALREIWDNCGVEISYKNIKKGRYIIGFHFTAVSFFHLEK